MNRSSLSREQWEYLEEIPLYEKYPQEGEDATSFLDGEEMKDYS